MHWNIAFTAFSLLLFEYPSPSLLGPVLSWGAACVYWGAVSSASDLRRTKMAAVPARYVRTPRERALKTRLRMLATERWWWIRIAQPHVHGPVRRWLMGYRRAFAI